MTIHPRASLLREFRTPPPSLEPHYAKQKVTVGTSISPRGRRIVTFSQQRNSRIRGLPVYLAGMTFRSYLLFAERARNLGKTTPLRKMTVGPLVSRQGAQQQCHCRGLLLLGRAPSTGWFGFTVMPVDCAKPIRKRSGRNQLNMVQWKRKSSHDHCILLLHKEVDRMKRLILLAGLLTGIVILSGC